MNFIEYLIYGISLAKFACPRPAHGTLKNCVHVFSELMKDTVKNDAPANDTPTNSALTDGALTWYYI